MNKYEGRRQLEPRVGNFKKGLGTYLSKEFSETEARNRFIDQFFTSLGWEMDQTGLPRKQWDVHREYSQRDNSSTKKPDYAFRVKAQDSGIYSVSFFVESKAPSISLTEPAPIFQAKRYAFSSHGKAPIVVLTNFYHFRAFDTSERPSFHKPFQGLLKGFDLDFTEYLDNWDLLWDTFSKDAVYAGSLAKLGGKRHRQTKSLDEEFLDDISKWRKQLSQDLIRNNNLSSTELNDATQRVIDRLVFIRNLEDRGIEDENLLLSISKQKSPRGTVYESLLPVFRRLNGLYNGLLFKSHFSEDLHVTDEVIRKIIDDMSFPESPFRFDAIRPEILGRIYETFLGSKIHVTPTKQVKIVEKPEVVHAKGVYYTPEYIVSQIVEKTVGRLIDGKTPDEISGLKVLDPACGSGSFLLGAYSSIVSYLTEWYASHGTKKAYREDYFVDRDGAIQLSARKKAAILVNNIFGVDIDNHATEVATMSLYLKLLDEGFDKGQATLFLKGHILPDMSGNIKCGNSIVEFDITKPSQCEQMSMFRMPRTALDGQEDLRPFSYQVAYKDVLGGRLFDCVVGNPPYIDSEEMVKTSPLTRQYCASKYVTAKGNWDIYCVFCEKAISLLNPNGYFSFIIPNKFISKPYGEHLKALFSLYAVNAIYDYTEVPVFVCHNRRISVYPIVIVIRKTAGPAPGQYVKYNENDGNVVQSASKHFRLRLHQTDWSEMFATPGIVRKALHHRPFVQLDRHFEVGNSATVSEAYILKDMLVERRPLSDTYFRFVNTGTIDRYLCLWGIEPTQYIKQRYSHPQLSMSAVKKTLPNRFKQFDTEKLILAGMVKQIEAMHDNGAVFAGKSTITIAQKSGIYSLKYLLGYLNSDIFTGIYVDRNRHNAMSGGYLNCSKGQLEQMPFYEPDLANLAQRQHYDEVVSLVNSILVLSGGYYAQQPGQRSSTVDNIEYIRNQIETSFASFLRIAK